MALPIESEAQRLIDSLSGMLIERNRQGASAWEIANLAGSLALERQRAQACLPRLNQALLESQQWYAGDLDSIARVQALKASLESIIASAI